METNWIKINNKRDYPSLIKSVENEESVFTEDVLATDGEDVYLGYFSFYPFDDSWEFFGTNANAELYLPNVGLPITHWQPVPALP